MRTTKNIQNALVRQLRYCHIFSKVKTAPPDSVYGMITAFQEDTHPDKVNLGLGAYKNWDLQPVVLDVVRKVQLELAADKTLNMEYIPIDGIPGFIKGSQKLIFGKDSSVLKENKVTSVQTLSGTGALRLGFQLIKQFMPTTVHLSDPSWPNHQRIATHAGLPIKFFPYYDPIARAVNLSNILKYLNTLEAGSIVLFQVCAHNPTATDPTPAEWTAIADVMEKKKIVPFFDSTYQGLSSANFDKDIWAIRHFAERGISMFIEQSYAKNMGMYGHRVGCLHIVTPDQSTASKVLSQLKVLIRANYSSPPLYGARIAEKITNSDALMQQWQAQLKIMTGRLDRARKVLRARLQQLKTPGNWQHVTNQSGFFVFTDLSESQCDHLLNHYHIHMMNNGRMAMIGLNSSNVDYVAQSIHTTKTTIK